MTPRRSGRGAERRRTTRADARLSMRVEGSGEESVDGQIVTESQNISASGVYCMSTHYMAPLSKVALTIVLPRVPGGRSTKELIKCEGIVVRCEQTAAKRAERPFELACMFSGLDTDVRQRIDAFVTWRNLQALRAAARATPRKKTAARRTRTGTTATRAGSTRAASASRSAAARRKTVH